MMTRDTTPSSTRAFLQQRLGNQQLSNPTLRSPQEVVACLGAVQAQDYTGAKWAVGMRAARITDADVERSYDHGSILRTHVLRPTWHFVAPADIRWMLTLTAPRVKASMAHAIRAVGLDQKMLIRGINVLERALRGRQYLTRTDLRPILHGAGFSPAGQRLAYLLIHAELEAVICSGPRRGKHATYALLEERVPPANGPRGDEAIAELTMRYFSSHGPASAADFAWWSGLTIREAKRGIETIGRQLVPVVIDERTYWSVSTNTPARGRAPAAHLLSNWDEYVVAYKDRAMLLRPGRGASLSGGREVIFANTVLLNGRIVGTWKRVVRNHAVVVEATRAARWTAADASAIQRAAKAYGAFLQRPASLVCA
jgi:winged helix DNA-binding protein